MKTHLINSDTELNQVLLKIVENNRVSYEKANESLLERYENNELTPEQLNTEIKNNYNHQFSILKQDIQELKISDDYSEKTPPLNLSNIFDAFEFEDDTQTLRSFVEDASAIDKLNKHIFDDTSSVEKRIQKTISIMNDSIVVSDKIGRLIDNKISSTISGVATEELGWIKAYQIIILKMSPEDRDAELSNFDKKLTPTGFNKKLKQRINKYQTKVKMHKPFAGSSYYFNPAKSGEADVFTKLPDGSMLIIAANKLVDNQMEGTQTVRHPMEVALNRLFPSSPKAQSTEIFDEFCRRVLDIEIYNQGNFGKLSSFFTDILKDKTQLNKLKEEYQSIHVHTFQAYNQPKYSARELENVNFFDKKDLDIETKEAKLCQIQATIQFRANNINNRMIEDRDKSKTGKQKSDAAGTLVDNRSLSWSGVNSFIDTYLDNNLESPGEYIDPVALVQKKMLKGSLPQRAAFATVIIDRIEQRVANGNLEKSKALSLLDIIKNSTINSGITAKTKYFTKDLSMIYKVIKQDHQLAERNTTMHKQESKGYDLKELEYSDEQIRDFRNWELSEAISNSDIQQKLIQLQPDLRIDLITPATKIVKHIKAHKLQGYEEILAICNKIDNPNAPTETQTPKKSATNADKGFLSKFTGMFGK